MGEETKRVNMEDTDPSEAPRINEDADTNPSEDAEGAGTSSTADTGDAGAEPDVDVPAEGGGASQGGGSGN